jgi:hypothetical protein
MDKPPRITHLPRSPIHANETRQDFIARALEARDQARASNTYVTADALLNRLDQSLARARNKPPST